MRATRVFTVLAAVAAIGVACGNDTTGIPTGVEIFVANLNGANERPTPVTTTASASSTTVNGSAIVVTYSATSNDTLTLVEQLPNGTQQVLFTNRPVTGGQAYTLTGTVGSQAGQRTLTLSNAAGTPVSCSFSAINNQ